MEYVDTPTLAEIYLFTPGDQDCWGEIVSGILGVIQAHLWSHADPAETKDLVKRCKSMYIDKPRRRFMRWWGGKLLSRSHYLYVNGRRLVAGPAALDKMQGVMEGIWHNPKPALIHGDLNFSNILYSAHSQTFRLLDPRGSFGGDQGPGDARYDVAKLRHSYAGMFDAAVHGLYRLQQTGSDQFVFHLGPDRSAAKNSIDQCLESFGFAMEEIRAIEASLFLSMLPLHASNPEKQWILYLRGLQLLDELLHDDQ